MVDIIKIFIVVTEEWYGGNVKIFRTNQEAQDYIDNANDEYDLIILERELYG